MPLLDKRYVTRILLSAREPPFAQDREIAGDVFDT